MHNYKGQLRRDNIQDRNPSMSSWDKQRQQLQTQKYQLSSYETKPQRQEDKYQLKYQSKHQNKFEKSQISYYQSQASRVVYDYEYSQHPSTRSQAYSPDQKYFFNEVMRVRMKSFEREQYEQNIRIQIQMKAQKNSSILTIYLTDDANPKFLWMFAIREGDFMNLKQDQKLKVSYGAFPDMLKDCFMQCNRGNQYQNQDKNNHLLLEIRKGGQGTLFILQSNRYKESVHLFLHFKLANDEQLKQHLSSKYTSASQELSKAKALISNLKNNLSEKEDELQRLSTQFVELKKDGDKRFQQLKIDEKKRVNEAQSKNLNELTKMKREHQLQLKELKQKLGSQIDYLSKNNTELSNKLSDARQKNANLQSNQRQKNIKISRLDQDASKYLKQYQILKVQNKELSDKRFQSQKLITELSCKIQALRSQVQDKKTIISSTTQLKETNNNQISSLQTINSQQRKQIIKLQTKITELQGEMSKVSSVNTELIQKISRQKEKLSERGQIIKQQQKEIKEIQKINLNLSRESQQLQYRNSEKDNKIKNLQQQLQITQQKMQDETKLVMALQKSLNQRAPLRTTSNYTGVYQPSAPYPGINRELPSQLSTNSNVSTSRVTTALNIPTSKTDLREPVVRRYQQKSKSPLSKILTQQRDPDQEQRGYQKVAADDKVGPVKFKFSQGNRLG